jgi:hypothetical protein
LENILWQRIEDWITQYCFGVMTALMTVIERAHPAVSIGLPLLVTAAVHWYLPQWVSMALAVLVWIPAAVGMTIFLVSCCPYLLRRHRDFT